MDRWGAHAAVRSRAKVIHAGRLWCWDRDVLSEADRASAVRCVAVVLLIRGPMAPRRVLRLLGDLGLLADDAEIAIEEAVTSGVLVEVEHGEKVGPGPAARRPLGNPGRPPHFPPVREGAYFDGRQRPKIRSPADGERSHADGLPLANGPESG